MKITLWGINYCPESTGIAPFNAELAEYLAGEDIDVSVVTGFAYYPLWRKAREDRFRLFRREVINGVPVYRCAQYVPAQVTTLGRILHELSFGLMSLLRVLLLPRADVYLVVSPPLCLGFFAWIATRLKQSRFVFHVQDLQPGAAVGLGMVKGRGFIRLLFALEQFAYRRAIAVSGISEGMVDEFKRKGVRGHRRIYFPNWLRASAEATPPASDFRERFGIPRDHLLAVYSGNLGRKQGIDILLDAAAQLADAASDARAPDITVVIAGAGAERAALEQQVAALSLPHLRLLPLLSDEDYSGMLATANVGLITQAPGTGRYFFPSKLLTLLQAGLPVVTVADTNSELARAVAEGGFGINVQPGRADALAEVFRQLSREPGVLRGMKERTDWVRRFEASEVLPQFLRDLERITSGANRTPALVGQHEPSRL